MTVDLPSRSRLLIRGGHVMTMDPTLGDRPGYDILVDAGVIKAIEPTITDATATVIEANRMIVLPGFVATHDHLWSALFRGVAGDEPPRDPWSVKEALAPHMTAEDTEASVRLACAEALAAGITSVISWGHNWTGPEEADANLRGLVGSGIRARYAPGSPSTKWGLSLAEMDAVMAGVGRRVNEPMDIADLARIKRDWFDGAAVDDRIRLGVSLRGPARSTPEVVEQEFRAARDLGVPIYMHCAGTLAEVGRIRQVEVLDGLGLLGPDLRLAHGMHLSSTDIQLMADHGVALAITPISELRLELGMAPLTELRQAGILVSLGFDNPAYAAAMDMFVTMRVTLGLERTRQGRVEAIGPRDVLEMATIDGARYLGLDDVAGSLTPGKRADIVLVRRDDLNLAPAGRPADALVFSAAPGNVDTVIADGRLLKVAGQLTACDPVGIAHEADAALRRICERAGATELLSA